MLCLLLCASFLQVEDNVTVILLSEIVWDTFRPNTGCFEPLLLHFPDYSKGIHRLTLLNLNLQSCFHKSGISFSWIFNSDAALYKFSSWWEAFIVKISCCFAVKSDMFCIFVNWRSVMLELYWCVCSWAAADFVSGQTSFLFRWALLLLRQRPAGSLLLGLPRPTRTATPGQKPKLHSKLRHFASAPDSFLLLLFPTGCPQLFKVLRAIGRRER